MTKITILGGSGFLGSVLADLLAKNNRYKVTVLDTKKKRPLLKNQIFIKGSILNENKLIKAIRGSKYVFNFAALADLDIAKNKPLETANINIIGTIKSLIISPVAKNQIFFAMRDTIFIKTCLKIIMKIIIIFSIVCLVGLVIYGGLVSY